MVDPRTAPYALLLLRVTLGVMFIAHAALKVFVFTVPGFAGFLAQVGMPSFMALPVILLEAFGGLALILGVYARAVALVLTPVLLGALSVHVGNGWLFTAPNGGWEYPAFLVIAGLTVVLGGDGALALRPTALPARERLATQTA
ncbi:LysR family transcriptional regulator [Alsobacter metallidurans]|uniref:LysR family transcriptional regulator n=1 Tax=Alsobacter metallidurans TaxID=340221 RepID=A0A917MHI3_9HYPH|nr:DoxX family protein [Alsobacter metallidurans]GGH17050.1 LysR family transcriptional regulator [Alsobacter metallidurans]